MWLAFWLCVVWAPINKIHIYTKISIYAAVICPAQAGLRASFLKKWRVLTVRLRLGERKKERNTEKERGGRVRLRLAIPYGRGVW